MNTVPEVTTTLVGMKSVIYVDDVQKSINNEFIARYTDYWHNNGSSI
jgi:hypothetical protein